MKAFFVRGALEFAEEVGTAPTTIYRSRIFVVPESNTSMRSSSYFDFVEACDGVVGMHEDYEPQDDRMKLQAIVFSGEAETRKIMSQEQLFETDRSIYLQTLAPWFTIQLIPYTDLYKSRGPGGQRGEDIRLHNLTLDANMLSPNIEKLDMIKSCRDNAKEKVIYVTKDFSKGHIERLKNEGVRVQMVETTEKKPPTKRNNVLGVSLAKKNRKQKTTKKKK